ncbi:MAG: ribonuclease P protein component [Bacteroidia bacterium]|nr:ribonuclease P protein component [Bacteroidia bacterium]
MCFKFTKNERLKSKKLFQSVFDNGKVITAYPLKISYLPISDTSIHKSQISVLVGKKKFKSAVRRNRVKRIIREAYRLNKHLIFNNIEGKYAFLILYIGDDLPTVETVEKAMVSLFNNLITVEKDEKADS